ncbi:hypothetical protein TcasGA2_TC031165 [Tribolium castaneum]|uniref:Uncharacterized protein n=1 Tax=Tribolium castaneum TaxID=7070 RepID=A0A139W8X1_TRICA|nr:hypothetical protein TcasGA2_TC031165 [Tribolium castaneum]
MKCQIRGLNNLEFSIEIENVGTAIQAEKHYHKSRQALGLGKITFDQYLRHAEINAYLAQLAKDYPDTVTLETIGQSISSFTTAYTVYRYVSIEENHRHDHQS